jgi:hypothetical protein
MINESELLTEPNSFQTVFYKANQTLKEIFGMQLTPIIKSNGPVTSWYLVSNLSVEDRSLLPKCIKSDEFKSLQIVILSLIYAHGSKMPASILYY